MFHPFAQPTLLHQDERSVNHSSLTDPHTFWAMAAMPPVHYDSLPSQDTAASHSATPSPSSSFSLSEEGGAPCLVQQCSPYLSHSTGATAPTSTAADMHHTQHTDSWTHHSTPMLTGCLSLDYGQQDLFAFFKSEVDPTAHNAQTVGVTQVPNALTHYGQPMLSSSGAPLFSNPPTPAMDTYPIHRSSLSTSSFATTPYPPNSSTKPVYSDAVPEERTSRSQSMPDVLAWQGDPQAMPRRQKPRHEGDFYTPQWVRYTGQQKEGYCDRCQPGKWLQLKNSAYWYHKQFFHGISSVSGKPFVKPLEQRLRQDVVEGLCHQCRQFVPICNTKRRTSVLWYRHAHKCHIYDKPKTTKRTGKK